MLSFCVNITLVMSTMFIFTCHPISMGLMIIFTTIILCLISGFILSSFWFSYIFFLVYLGGMLILFLYMSSLTPNKMFFKFKHKLTLVLMMLFPMIKLSNNISSLLFSSSHLFLLKNFSTSTFPLTLILITFLLITLTSMNYITNVENSPLSTSN